MSTFAASLHRPASPPDVGRTVSSWQTAACVCLESKTLSTHNNDNWLANITHAIKTHINYTAMVNVYYTTWRRPEIISFLWIWWNTERAWGPVLEKRQELEDALHPLLKPKCPLSSTNSIHKLIARYLLAGPRFTAGRLWPLKQQKMG